jgi:hypothetical protein
MVLILLRRGSNGKRPDPPLTNAALAAGFAPIHKEKKKAPGVPGLFLYCRRQLFANALMAGLARRAFRRGLCQ